MDHPTKLAKYTIDAVIGEGAMGVVYKATDTVLRRTVAIKMLRRQLVEQGGGGSLLARFRNEAQAAGRLMHPNIVAVHDYGEHALGPYIVMEHVQGTTLKEPLRERVRFSDEEVVDLMLQLLEGLHFAHEQGVWHRDVKPANLLLTPSRRLKIADFGVARITNVGLTQVSSTIGTPGHMAPEQYAGEQIDRRVDIFAAGVLLYQLLTQRAPFAGASESVMFQTLHVQPPAPSQVHGSERPDWFDAVVARAMAKRPQDRYPTALEFGAALRRRGGVEETAREAPPPAPARAAAAAQEGAATAPSGPGSAGSAGSAPGSQWDPDTLALVERELAHAIGPMARVLVRRAAKSSVDVESLRQLLASQIERTEAREQFLRRTRPRTAGVTGTHPTGGSTAPSTSTPAPAPAPVPAPRHDTLFGEQLAREAEIELTRHVGPIARVLVARAAARARSRDEFLALLVEHVPDEAGRERLRQALLKASRRI
jgi:serine/threonine-protein kinase